VSSALSLAALLALCALRPNAPVARIERSEIRG
jgi:hypothetical protein